MDLEPQAAPRPEDIEGLLIARVVEPWMMCSAKYLKLSNEAVSKYYKPSLELMCQKFFEDRKNATSIDFMQIAHALIIKMTHITTNVTVSQLGDGMLCCQYSMAGGQYQFTLPISPYADNIRSIAFELLHAYYGEDIGFTNQLDIKYMEWVKSWSGADMIDKVATGELIVEENNEALVKIFKLKSVDAFGVAILHFVQYADSRVRLATSITSFHSDTNPYITINLAGLDPRSYAVPVDITYCATEGHTLDEQLQPIRTIF